MPHLMTGGQAVMASLRAAGVEVVFGIPGVHNLALYDALIEHPEIRHYLVRDEQGAVFLADGYARASGRPTVALTTTGPGATNSLTPMAEAFASSVPILLIASDVESRLLGKELGVLHEIRAQTRIFRSVAEPAELIREIPEIPGTIHKVFAGFRGARPRPAYLGIPTDLIGGKAKVEIPALRAPDRLDPDPAVVRRAADLLVEANAPILYAGGGVVSADAAKEFQALAEHLGAPVLTSTMGRGVVADDHPLFGGTLRGSPVVEGLFGSADCLLAVGTRLSQRSSLRIKAPVPRPLIHVDIDPAEIGKRLPTEVGMAGDARKALVAILAEVRARLPQARPWPVETIRGLRAQATQALRERDPRVLEYLQAVRETLDRDAIVAMDQTIICYWAEGYFPVYHPRTCLYPVGSGTLGYGMPAALGAKIACPERQVICLCGDGGFMFTCQELSTAVHYKLGVAMLLFNDAELGVIRHLQERRFGRSCHVALTNPDFVAFANSLGVRGMRATSPDALREALRSALQLEGPSLIEVPVALLPPAW